MQDKNAERKKQFEILNGILGRSCWERRFEILNSSASPEALIPFRRAISTFDLKAETLRNKNLLEQNFFVNVSIRFRFPFLLWHFPEFPFLKNTAKIFLDS